MDKLTISKEQEKELIHFIGGRHADSVMKDFMECGPNPNYELDTDFTPQQFALLLCGWYEVEPEYKEGDWVYHEASDRVAPIDQRGVDGENVWVDDEEFNFFSTDQIRHATPDEIAQEKERRKWSSIGREVDEYKVGDVVSTGSITRQINAIAHAYKDFYLEGMGTENTYSAHEVFLVCPVEQRFDKEDTHV